MAEQAQGDQALARVPEHIGFIMDGNGRWAQARGLPRNAGHQAGRENVRKVLEDCADFGIKVVTLYAFSTENWKRPVSEVRGLMSIFESATDEDIRELDRNGIQVRHIGRLEGLSPLLRRKINRSVEATKDNQRLIANIALNYGGRAEIVDAVRQCIADGLTADEITEEALGARLSTRDCPDPDLIVRTAGEMRMSNFLVWQAAYAEYYVSEKYWPDFDRQELEKALIAFGGRHRRFGQLDWQMKGE
jgi:undecaprenyl diphosphate synthase